MTVLSLGPARSWQAPRLLAALVWLTAQACGGHQTTTKMTTTTMPQLHEDVRAAEVSDEGDAKSSQADEAPAAATQEDGPERSGPPRLDTPTWLDAAQAVAEGGTYSPPQNDETAQDTLAALGYRPLPNSSDWMRDANLLLEQPLAMSSMAELPQIDAIAMISTFRPYLQEQYIYPSLKKLFTALPPTAIVNILVGNAQTDYVQPDVLAHAIGADFASRVHIVPAPESTSRYFDTVQAWIAKRATWNYARALRSYRGTTNLLLVEDDIDVAPGAFSSLRPYLAAEVAGIYLMYNDRCKVGKPMWAMPESAVTIHPFTIRLNSEFPTTQAIVYSSSVAHHVGDYIAVRAGRESYDYMIGRYLADFEYVIGYVYPSVVQHTGLLTSGLSAPGHAPYSWCFDPNI